MLRLIGSFSLYLMAVCLILLQAPNRAAAQEAYYVRFQAEPNVDDAIEEASRYARTLSDVQVFALNGGWFALTLGPYSQPFAEITQQSLGLAGAIPSDSFVVASTDLGPSVWPNEGQSAQRPSVILSPSTSDTANLRIATPTIAPRFELDAAMRKEVQTVLAWQGYYTSTIDGIFGQGTRRAIAAWQRAAGFDATGELTEESYNALIAPYNAIFEDVGMARVTDERAGIAIDIPTTMVTRKGEEAPFAIYEDPNGGLAKVLLISMTGGADELSALYEVMQNFDIMPREGSRYLRSNSFVITGNKGDTAVYTEASRDGDEIKGFALIWPRDDEERRTMLIERMRNSLTRLGGTLSAAATIDFDIDGFLSFGKRKPSHVWSGVYLNDQGYILTAYSPTEQCRDLTIDRDWSAKHIASAPELGVSVIKPNEKEFQSLRYSPLSIDPLAIGQELHLFGYSFGMRALAPAYSVGTVSTGTPDDLAQQGRQQLKLAALEGDQGAPLLDTRGLLRAIITPQSGPRALPEGFAMSTHLAAILPWLKETGVHVSLAPKTAPDLGETLPSHGYETVALLQCWD